MVAPLVALAAATAARSEHEADATPAVQEAPDAKSLVVPTMNCGAAAWATDDPIGVTRIGAITNALASAPQNPILFVPILPPTVAKYLHIKRLEAPGQCRATL